MRVHESVDVARILGSLRGHMAIGALLRLGRIVERSSTLPGNTARLPVVILVKAAEPAIVIHRHVEMHLMARRAELRRLRRA